MIIYKNKQLLNLLYELWGHISRARKFQFICLIPMIFFTAIFEAVNIGLLVPFITALSKPSETYLAVIEKFPIFANIRFITADNFLYLISIFLVIVTVFATFIKSILIILQTKISYGIGADLSINIFHKILYQPYQTHISRNSSDVISIITNKTTLVATETIYPAINIIASLFISIFIILLLVNINLLFTILSLVGFSCGYVIIILFAKNKIKYDSERISKQMNLRVKLVQESLGGIRDILIDRSQSVFINNFTSTERNLRYSLANLQLISTIPRLAIESTTLILIVFFTLFISIKIGNVMDSLPFIGVIAIAGQKLLPMLNQIYIGWTSIAGSKSNAQEVLNYLNQKDFRPIGNNLLKEFSFNSVLELRDVSYRYDSSENRVLNNVNLKIKKGEVIGIIGTSGSGKSTLIDLILGLIDPISGDITVDGKSIIKLNEKLLWQKKIAHVPQNVYLLDATFAENIAFGLPIEHINLEQVILAAKLAHISNFIESRANSYASMVGERGIQLSGGQLQRIGIARAFYKQSEVIIFDEATSALDDLTENQIFHSISLLPRTVTILIVSHRPQTLKNCNRIIELSEGNLIDSTRKLGLLNKNS